MGGMFLASIWFCVSPLHIFGDWEIVVAVCQNSKINWQSPSPKASKRRFHGKPPQIFSLKLYMDFPCDNLWQEVSAIANCLENESCRWASLNWHNYTQKGILVMSIIPWFMGNKVGISNSNIVKKGEFLFSGSKVPLKFWKKVFHIFFI